MQSLEKFLLVNINLKIETLWFDVILMDFLMKVGAHPDFGEDYIGKPVTAF